MQIQELKLDKLNFNFNLNTYPKGSHVKLLIILGRCFPQTKEQAKYFIKKGAKLDVLNYKDVQDLEAFLNKQNFKGQYKYTKSLTWVRLINQNDFISALKKEHNI
jgi:hypothetical protein